MDSRSKPLRPWFASPYLMLTLAPLFWACNWIVGRGVSASVPPMAMTFYRWLLAICILAPFAWPHVAREWREIKSHYRMLILLGIVGVGSQNALVYLALQYTTATNGVILNSFIPIMIVALSWIMLGQRLSLVQLLGVGVSLCGVLAILSHGSLQTLTALRLNRGDVFVITSMLLWSIYTVCLRWRPAGLNMLSFLFVIACIGDLSVLPLYLTEMALGYRMTVSALTVSAIGSAALLSSVLAYIFWNRGVVAVGPGVAGLFVHLVPVYGTILAGVFLDERLQVFHVVGIALILTGIYVTSRRAQPTSVSPRRSEAAGEAPRG